MSQRIRTLRRGFTLVEMLFYLGLIGLFMSAATQLFHISFKTIRATELAQTQAARIDHLLAALRRDAWDARKVQSSDRDLSLELGPDRSVVWTLSSDGGMIRIGRRGGQPAEEREWKNLPAMKFEKSASGIVLIVAGERVELASPMLQAQLHAEAAR